MPGRLITGFIVGVGVAVGITVGFGEERAGIFFLLFKVIGCPIKVMIKRAAINNINFFTKQNLLP